MVPQEMLRNRKKKEKKKNWDTTKHVTAKFPIKIRKKEIKWQENNFRIQV